MLDIASNSFYESTQNLRQIFYTPIRLKTIFEEIGFIRRNFEFYFFDNDYFEKENERIYGLPQDSGLCIWEIFTVLEK